jgi:hypothetical protein
MDIQVIFRLDLLQKFMHLRGLGVRMSPQLSRRWFGVHSHGGHQRWQLSRRMRKEKKRERGNQLEVYTVETGEFMSLVNEIISARGRVPPPSEKRSRWS